MSSEHCTDLARNAYMTARVPFLDVFPCRPDAPLPICLGRDRDLIAVLAVLPPSPQEGTCKYSIAQRCGCCTPQRSSCRVLSA